MSQQKRTLLILANAGGIILLSCTYQNIQFDFYYRLALPLIAYALVAVRFISFVDHAITQDGKIYQRDFITQQFSISPEMTTYQTSLILQHILLASGLLAEIYYLCQQQAPIWPFMCLVLISIFQGTEAWFYRLAYMEERWKLQSHPTSLESIL